MQIKTIKIMNTYEIKIKGMHCSGCKNLISLNLEEKGFLDISVNLENNTGKFSSDKSFEETQRIAQKAIKESGHYSLELIQLIQT